MSLACGAPKMNDPFGLWPGFSGSGSVAGMSNYVPLSGSHKSKFFDWQGQPLAGASSCPTCGQRRPFTASSTGSQVFLVGTECGHRFVISVSEM